MLIPRAQLQKKRVGRRRTSSATNQAAFVRRDDWLTPLTVDERSDAFSQNIAAVTG